MVKKNTIDLNGKTVMEKTINYGEFPIINRLTE